MYLAVDSGISAEYFVCLLYFNAKIQERKSAYNVILRRIRITVVATQNKEVLYILSVCL
jgi:hypothetical protein